MGAFVLVSADALDQKFMTNAYLTAQDQSFEPVASSLAIRRPYRGIQIKNDTFATLSIVDGNGKAIQLFSESALDTRETGDTTGRVDAYADFILQSIDDERVEKQQIIETFGDSFIFFFGERPRLVTISGVLMNTEDFNWRSQFWHNYDQYLRGTKLVQRNARCFLAYDSVVIEGYPIMAKAIAQADSPYMVHFQMQLFLTNYMDFHVIGDTSFPGQDQQFDVETLNRELQATRDAYISIGSQVRVKNFGYTPAASIGSVIRTGIRAINDASMQLSALMDFAKNIYYGRTVALPAGYAGFLAANNTVGGVAAAGFTDEQKLLFQAETGSTTKLFVPTQAKFAPVILPRGKFSDNTDEYPFREQESSFLSLAQQAELRTRRAEAEVRAADRRFRRELSEAGLAAASIVQKTSTAISTVINDLASLARTGFTTYVTVRAIAADPGAATAVALGIGEVVSNEVNPVRAETEETAVAKEKRNNQARDKQLKADADRQAAADEAAAARAEQARTATSSSRAIQAQLSAQLQKETPQSLRAARRAANVATESTVIQADREAARIITSQSRSTQVQEALSQTRADAAQLRRERAARARQSVDLPPARISAADLARQRRNESAALGAVYIPGESVAQVLARRRLANTRGGN